MLNMNKENKLRRSKVLTNVSTIFISKNKKNVGGGNEIWLNREILHGIQTARKREL